MSGCGGCGGDCGNANGLLGYRVWAVGTTYTLDEFVQYGDILYRAKRTTLGERPDLNPSAWEATTTSLEITDILLGSIPLNIGKWVKSSIAYTDFAGFGSTATLFLYNLPLGGVIHSAVIYPTVAFAGSSITGVTLSLGTFGLPRTIAPAFDVTATPSGDNFQITNVEQSYDMLNVTQILITGTATGATLNALSAGAADIYLFVTQINV